jgi:hypothetical protein
VKVKLLCWHFSSQKNQSLHPTYNNYLILYFQRTYFTLALMNLISHVTTKMRKKREKSLYASKKMLKYLVQERLEKKDSYFKYLKACQTVDGLSFIYVIWMDRRTNSKLKLQVNKLLFNNTKVASRSKWKWKRVVFKWKVHGGRNPCIIWVIKYDDFMDLHCS